MQTGFSGSGLLGQNSSVYSTASALVIAALIAAQCADTVSLCCATIGICADFVFAFFPAFLVILTVSGSSLTGVSTNTLLLGLARQGICFFPILPLMVRLWGVWGIASVQGAADMLVMLLAVPIAVRVSRDIRRREAEQGGEISPV